MKISPGFSWPFHGTFMAHESQLPFWLFEFFMGWWKAHEHHENSMKAL